MTPYPPRNQQRQRINWSLTRWIVCNKRPFFIVEYPEFSDLIKVMDPKYVIPSRTTIQKLAGKMFRATKEAVRATL